MESAYAGALAGGTREARLIAVAGALAESAITYLEAEFTDGTTIELAACMTDLPGLLSGPPEATALRARSGTTIILRPGSIEWTTHDAEVHAALVRSQASME